MANLARCRTGVPPARRCSASSRLPSMYRVGAKPLTKGDEYAMKRPRSRRVPWHGLLFVVDELFQFFARLEIGNLLGRHVHFFTGLGVTSLARLPLTDTKATEAAEVNLVAPV